MAKPDPLYLTEGEIAARIGVSTADWKATAAVLERQGLPKPEALFMNRRYWPAVRAFLDRRYDLLPEHGQGGHCVSEGIERWTYVEQKPRQKRRPPAKDINVLDDADKHYDPVTADRGRKLGLIERSDDGAWGVHNGIRITNAGRRALGEDVPFSPIEKFEALISQAFDRICKRFTKVDQTR